MSGDLTPSLSVSLGRRNKDLKGEGKRAHEYNIGTYVSPLLQSVGLIMTPPPEHRKTPGGP